MILGVKPGKSGQAFILDVISKLQELREIQDRYNFLIEVDGGINNQTIQYVKNYVDIIVSGSFVTDSNDYNKQIEILKNM